MIFTHKEKTVKDKTVDEAVKQALFVLNEEHKGTKPNTKAADKYSDKNTPITVEQMSDLINCILKDSLVPFYH